MQYTMTVRELKDELAKVKPEDEEKLVLFDAHGMEMPVAEVRVTATLVLIR